MANEQKTTYFLVTGRNLQAWKSYTINTKYKKKLKIKLQKTQLILARAQTVNQHLNLMVWYTPHSDGQWLFIISDTLIALFYLRI